MVELLDSTHASAYRALMLEAYAVHPEAFTSSVNERASLPLAWWEERLSTAADAREAALGVLQDGDLVGAVGVAFDAREKARHKALVFGMYVAQRFRRRGLARRLIEAAIAQACARPHIRVLQLTVTEGNRAAQDLYEQCGFAVFGVEPYAVAVGSGYVSKVHMWCDLRVVPKGIS
jgi:ribosomal protein S18 acetylase RimI-like enzyme